MSRMDDLVTQRLVAERRVRDSVRNGWVRIVGEDRFGRDVYRLTDAGAERARAFGVPIGDQR